LREAIGGLVCHDKSPEKYGTGEHEGTDLRRGEEGDA
jgi:hypothetical protein